MVIHCGKSIVFSSCIILISFLVHSNSSPFGKDTNMPLSKSNAYLASSSESNSANIVLNAFQ